MPPDEEIDYAAIHAQQMPPPPPLVNLVSDDEHPPNPQVDQVALLENEIEHTQTGNPPPTSPPMQIERQVTIEPVTPADTNKKKKQVSTPTTTTTTTPGIEPATGDNRKQQHGSEKKDKRLGDSNDGNSSNNAKKKLLFNDIEVFEKLTQEPATQAENVHRQSLDTAPRSSTLDGPVQMQQQTSGNEAQDLLVFEPVTQEGEQQTRTRPANTNNIIDDTFIPDPLDDELPPLFPEIPPDVAQELLTTGPPIKPGGAQENETIAGVKQTNEKKKNPRVLDPRDEEEDKILPQVPHPPPQTHQKTADVHTNSPETPDDDTTPIRRKRRGRPKRRLEQDPEESSGLDSDPDSSPTITLRNQNTAANNNANKKRRKPFSILSSDEDDEESIQEVEVTPTGQNKRRKKRLDYASEEEEDAMLEDAPPPGRFYWQKQPGTRRRSRRIAQNDLGSSASDGPGDQVVDVDALPVSLNNKTRKRKRPARPGNRRSAPNLRPLRQTENNEDSDADSGPIWLDYSPEKYPRNRAKKQRRGSRTYYDSELEDDEDTVVLRRNNNNTKKKRKRTQPSTIVSDYDDEDDVRERRKRKRARLRKRSENKSLGKAGPYGYKKDGFVVSDNSDSESSASASPTVSRDDPSDGGSDYSGPDGEHSSSEDEDPLWTHRNKQVKKALKGKRPPFPKAMVCAICKWAALPALGSAKNGWRDGYVQPGANFSASVKRGKYGVRMTKPYCLQHTAGDQNKYIECLQETAKRNNMALSSSDDESSSDSDDDSIVMNNTSNNNRSSSVSAVQILDDDDEEEVVESNNGESKAAQDLKSDSNNEVVAMTETNPENIQLSAEKTWLQSGSDSDIHIMTLHGAQWDWEKGQYYIPPGINIKPLRRFVVAE